MWYVELVEDMAPGWMLVVASGVSGCWLGDDVVVEKS
jgi:hypothetical protein